MVAVLGQRNRSFDVVANSRLTADNLGSATHHELRQLFGQLAEEMRRRHLVLALPTGETQAIFDSDYFSTIAQLESSEQMFMCLGQALGARERVLDVLCACDDLIIASRGSVPPSEALAERQMFLQVATETLTSLDQAGDHYGISDGHPTSRMLGTISSELQSLRSGLLPYRAPPAPTIARALAAIESNPQAFSTLSAELRNNRTVAMAAVRLDGTLLAQVGPSLVGDIAVVRLAMATEPDAYTMCAEPALNDLDLAILYASNGATHLEQFPAGLQSNTRLLRALIASTPAIAAELPSAIMANPARLAEIVGPHFQANSALPPAYASDLRFWRELGRQTTHDVTFELLREIAALSETEFEVLRSQVAAAGFTRYTAFANLAVLRRVLADARPQPNDTRPVALVAVASEDWNGAFVDHPQFMAELQRTHRVVYRELRSDADLVTAFRSLGEARADFVMLGGHGEPRSTHFGQSTDESSMLDVATDGSLAGLHLERFLTRSCHVVLLSCSTGAGGPLAANVTNLTARMLPGATIHAPTTPSNFTHFLREGNRVIGVEWVDPGPHYSVQLDRSTPLGRAVTARLDSRFRSRAQSARRILTETDLQPFFRTAAEAMTRRRVQLALPGGRTIRGADLAELSTQSLDAMRATLGDWLGMGADLRLENTLTWTLALDDVLAAVRSHGVTVRLREWLWEQVVAERPSTYQQNQVVADVVQSNGTVRPLPSAGVLRIPAGN